MPASIVQARGEAQPGAGLRLHSLDLWRQRALLLMTANFRGIIDVLLEAAENFIMAWNDLFTPMIFLQSMEKRTVMVALAVYLIV
jgi:hypothetical protein